MSSQRHKVEMYGHSSAGEEHAQGAIAPKVIVGNAPGPAPVPDRPYPFGPYPILRIVVREEPAGVWYVVAIDGGDNIINGDTVEVEATGDADTNGRFTVDERHDENDEVMLFRSGIPNATLPIEGKGRITAVRL